MSDREKYIDLLEIFPDRLNEIIEKLKGNLDTPYGSGKWTARQLVHHLADSHMNGYARMKWVLTEDAPDLKPYDQDKWAKLPDSKLPVYISLEILKVLHKRMVCLLQNYREYDLSRSAYHSEDGDLTLDLLLQAYALHGEKHIGHLRMLLDK